MAYLDEFAEFCDDTTITATVTNALVGDVVDLGTASLNLGTTDIWFVAKIGTAVTSNSTGTITLTLLSDSTANLATSATTHFTASAVKGTLVAGYKWIAVKLPAGTYERYLGIFCQSDSVLLGGTLNAYLTLVEPMWQAYPDAL
ncbi:MAG: hypothetical protein M0Q43_07585 [Methanothrix sp.]|jgi:hypothetical protein|nr:hypothetical protein [Methanothrix sp.]